MELRVKAVRPAAWGWSGGKVTNWKAEILLEDDQDIWTLVREEKPRYDYVHLDPDRTLYLSQDAESGLSSFYLYDRTNTSGYGGREIPVKLINGATITMKGPWSSNSGVVNRVIEEDWFSSTKQYVTEVTFYSFGDWRNVGMAAAMSVPKLWELIEKYLGNRWHLSREPLGDGFTYNLHEPETVHCEGRYGS